VNEEFLTKQLQALARHLQESYGYTPEGIAQLIQGEHNVPATVFSCELSPLQALVTYLKTVQNKDLKWIAKELKRSYRAVWGALQKENIQPEPTTYFLPLSIFNEKYSILEAAVVHLHDHYGLKYSSIGRLLKKDDRTIWTTYQRAKKKDES